MDDSKARRKERVARVAFAAVIMLFFSIVVIGAINGATNDTGARFAGYALLASIDTIVLVAGQIFIAFAQLDLQRYEITLVEQQGAILSRKANLTYRLVEANLDVSEEDYLGLRIAIKNTGNNTISDCTVILLFPVASPFEPTNYHEGRALYFNTRYTGTETYDGREYVREEFDVHGLFVENHEVSLYWY